MMHSPTRGGDPSNETYPLICDGRVIQIQRNLYIALPYLVHRPSNRPMWIDAVCINQKDGSEKMVQIGMMNDVYKRATKVWIWLKPVPSEELNAAEEAVGYISRISEASFNSKQLERATFTTSQLRLPSASSAAWNIIIDILEAPWFTRLWIIQEFTVANSAAFLFGDHVISSDNLQATNNVLHKPRHLLDDEGHNLAPKLYNSGFSSAHFYCRDQYLNHTLDSFHAAGMFVFLSMAQRCYNQKDRVFALLGLFKREELSGFRFDDKPSLPELYARLVWFLLSNRTYTATWRYRLWFAIDTGKADSEFPSWCLDFHQLHQMKRLEVGSTGQFGVHSASTRQMYRKMGQTWREIVLRGHVFDKVQRVGERMTELFNNNTANNCRWSVEAQRWEIQAAEMISQSRIPNFTESASRSGSWKLSQSEHFHFLFQYTGKDGSKPIKLDEFLHLKALLDEAVSIVQQFDLGKCIEFLEEPEKYQSVYTKLTRLRSILELFESDSGKLLRLAIESHRCRRPFVTANNRFGFLSGNEVALGGLVCLFHGLPVHHIIRNREDKSNFVTYWLVGKAVIYNHMNGELDLQSLRNSTLSETPEITLL